MNSKEINIIILAVLFCFFTLNTAYPQVAINTNGAQPNSSSILDVSSTTKGLLIPCMTEAQRNAITVTSTEKGLLVFQTDGTMGFYFYSGSSWVAIFNSLTSGVGGTGTSNYIPYWTASNNIGNSGLYWNGTNLGIGTTTPNNKLQIGSTTYSVNSLAMGNGTQNFAIDISARTIPTFFSDNNFSFMGSGGSGNVGIGTTTPASKLHIAGADMNNALLFENTSANPGSNYMLFKTQGTEQGYIGLGSGVSNNMYISAYGASNNLLLVTNNIPRMTILPSGEVGIGTTTPSQKLDVAGNIKITNQGGPVATPDKIDLGTSYSNGASRDQLKIYLYDGGSPQRYGFGIGVSSDIQYHSQVAHDFYVDNSKRFSVTGSGGANTSDRRLKRDILPLNKYGLQQVMQLNPVTYIFKDDSANTPQVGFIAQEVKQIIPEVVTGKEGDLSIGETLGIVYGNLVPVLTKAIQEQQSEIEELKTKNEELKIKNEGYETRLSKLERNNQTADNASFGGNISTSVIVLIIGIGVALFYYRKTYNNFNNKH